MCHDNSLVYNDLVRKGLIVKDGMNYGATFSIYEDDPEQFHGHGLVFLKHSNEELKISSIIRWNRISTFANKKNLTGWNIRFSNQPGKGESYYSEEQIPTERSEHSLLKVPSGLHCGPAGRRTLIKWLEGNGDLKQKYCVLDNYKLSRGINNANPGVMACRLWQESQGLPDEVSKAIVGLLKLQGIPTNITYRVLFENYLSKQLSSLMKRHSDSQEKLSMLAEKMISMFQVTQIQPLIVDVLDLLVEIPQSAMAKILEDTYSSHHFYKISTLNIKRKIWSASPEKLNETIIPLILKALFLLRLGIFDDQMGNLSSNENLNEYNMLIGQMLQLIGDPQAECSRIVYCQTVTILKLLFIKSSLQYKTNTIKHTNVVNANDSRNKSGTNKNVEDRMVKVSKTAECSLTFQSERFSEVKNKNLDLHYTKVLPQDLCDLYTKYANKTIGLSYSYITHSTNNKINYDLEEIVESNRSLNDTFHSTDTAKSEYRTKSMNETTDSVKIENILENVISSDIDNDLLYPDRGEHYYSLIRYSLAMKCQEMYKITNANMKLIEPNFNLLQLINKVHNSVDNNLPTDELISMINKNNTYNITVKDDMELFNISFILCNPLLYNKVVSYFVYYLFNMDMMLLTSKVEIGYWIALISLGLSCTYIGIVKFILESQLNNVMKINDDDLDLKKSVSYLKQYIKVCKPVSLKKLLKYIYPIEKDSRLFILKVPPFFSNFLTSNLTSQNSSDNKSDNSIHEDSVKNPFRRLGEFRIEFDDKEGSAYKIFEGDPDTSFHSLLILYLPKLDSKSVNEFKGSSRSFLNLFRNDQAENSPKDTPSRTPLRFTDEENKNIILKILEQFDHQKFDSYSHIGNLLSLTNRHYSSVKSAQTTIGQINLALLNIFLEKLSTLPYTMLNTLSSTSNITKLLFKMVSIELIKTSLKNVDGLNQNSEGLKKFISSDRFKREAVVNFKTPTDYLYLKLLATIMFSDTVKPKDPVFKFAENVSNYSICTSFILLYYYKKYGKDKSTEQTLERLSKNCHKILYDKENKNNPSYPYRKWSYLFQEINKD
ncbi:uncharacterized protein TA05930 [Theileria annulata]|uniref:tRNA-intron lyase n=1 Tax=Theileria annulata TaxID=5874 RepID=Q4UI26_THEAN|nr:uncharacterized protein TA05930 [Theileria annulata]CAI73263.1 hypothetical protein, conserved [Theileria annulata]|eukprot:XP_953940.1 hypothetical protein, conserved [Theileria annulata]